MRFGQDLHRRIIPEWSEYYVDYSLLKGLIKSSAPPKVFEHLEIGISTLESFYRHQFESLDAVEKELCDLYGFTTAPTRVENASEICPFELTLLLEAFSEFQLDLKKLQWFERVNTDAVTRVFAKLERYGEKEGPFYRRSLARWRALQSAWEIQLFDRLRRLDVLIADIDRGLTLPKRNEGRSLYLARVFRQNPCPQAVTDAVEQALQHGDIGFIVQLLRSSDVKLGVLEQTSKNLIRALLIFSAVRVPAHYEALLALLALSEQPEIKRDVLKWSILALGRSQKLHSYQGTKSAYREHFLAGIEVGERWISQVLLAGDRFGRLPLHYAAGYGLLVVCQKLLVEPWDKSTDTQAAVRTILSADDEALTPLHHAVVGNHALTAAYLIDFIIARNAAGEESAARTIMGDLLHIALRNQNDQIVRCLLQGRADLSRLSCRGETALHVAAQLGRLDYTALVLKAMSEEAAELDVPDSSRGWTPLFIACADGHYAIVELLLKAGLSQQRTDHLGWTAKEHAVFKGHLAVAELFRTSDMRDLTGGPASVSMSKTKHASVHCGKDEKIVIATLGTARKDRVVAGVDLSYCSSVHAPGTYEGLSFALEVSALGTKSEPRRVRLPILDDQINGPFVFPIPGAMEPQLVFKVIRLTGRPGEEILVGSGTALIESNSHQFGAGRQSLIREQTIPILDKDTMAVSGTVTFTFLVAKPFPHLQTLRPVGLSGKASEAPLLVGHRGAGQNSKTHDYLQLGENTVESFLSAAKLGASFVEFDVQVTRDLEAVAFHDFSLSESGTDVAIHDLTLDQFLHASNIQSPHGNPLSVLGKVHSRAEPGRPRSRSLGRQFEAGAIQIRDRMKHTVDFKQKGFKPNTRGDFIQDSFATLREILLELPRDIGCDIEIKYPRLHEAVDAGVAPVAIELNIFVDAALNELHRYAGRRQIILSSFTPEVCILLATKQKAYPVFFITNAGKVPMSDMEVRAASVQVAVQFAQRWNLAGVVFACEALLLCPRLVGFLKARGLVVATYGGMNNAPEMVKVQAEAGVDIIVADRVGLVARTLGAISGLNECRN
ncbi:Glycerophosphoryl diester phosphodiesterase family-domain-containing protein [Diplogelasinospora grovesii]|uniref:Glycerophosphoryl diester phosphodiesterase family-domain-containing protein n=1 Tax=Diplogelasinospora grovesii TaxID=303347 RepID=A0AAN6MXI5_9PEZI|nr:Glycerophosphoryl diester phosphodiesterase family-domain-containing protein [Diplogelasinospora grovesii]